MKTEMIMTCISWEILFFSKSLGLQGKKDIIMRFSSSTSPFQIETLYIYMYLYIIFKEIPLSSAIFNNLVLNSVVSHVIKFHKSREMTGEQY